MKRFFACVAVVFLATMLTGCGVSSYLTSNMNLNQTNVVLQDNNYHIVKGVEAEVSATYVFGIGGLSEKALRGNAVAELAEVANLTGSQALINVTLKEDIQSFVVLTKRTVRAKGIVIEFDE